jgi:hypothetical protein
MKSKVPKIKSESLSEEEVDRLIKSNLDEEGMIRMKAVDLAIAFFKDKQVSDIRHFQKTYEDIYKFILNLEKDDTKEGIYQGPLR